MTARPSSQCERDDLCSRGICTAEVCVVRVVSWTAVRHQRVALHEYGAAKGKRAGINTKGSEAVASTSEFVI